MTSTENTEAGPSSWRTTLDRALFTPVRAFRLAYLPLLMVYFAYGALGLTAIAQSFWVRRELSLSPVDLATLNVWLTLPWSVKMVFGELVDTIPLFGSRRRSYVFLGAALVAASMLLLAAAAGRWLPGLAADHLFVIASLLAVTGVVIQDVVADAMSTEVVSRTHSDGTPRAQADVDRDLGMVQVLGRLALYLGIFATAGLAGLLAGWFSYETVFLIGLIVPVISVTGAVLVRLESSESRPTDWRILGGGIAFGGAVTALAFTRLPYTQEIVLAISLFVIVTMLKRVTGDVPASVQRSLFAAAAVIFAFRATPPIGEGYRWFMIDRLGFSETFFGVLNQTGAMIGLAAAWLFSDAVTRRPVTQVLFWITIAGTILWLPNLVLIHGWYEWSRPFGLGPHEIALFDAAAASPLVQLSMIPMLTLIARSAPPGHRATWFALMASLMNLALVTGEVGSKMLNSVFVIARGDYTELAPLAWAVAVLGLVIPLAALWMLGRRAVEPSPSIPR